MDDIRTGYEVPSGGFKNNGGGPSWKMILVVISLFIAWILPQALGGKEQSKQTTTIQQPSQIQTDAQSASPEVKTGDVSGEMTDFFYSTDMSKATIEAHVTNGTNRAISEVVVTLTITDSSENVLAEKTITTPNVILSGETVDYTTVIEMPVKPTGYTQAEMDLQYKIPMF